MRSKRNKEEKEAKLQVKHKKIVGDACPLETASVEKHKVSGPSFLKFCASSETGLNLCVDFSFNPSDWAEYLLSGSSTTQHYKKFGGFREEVLSLAEHKKLMRSTAERDSVDVLSSPKNLASDSVVETTNSRANLKTFKIRNTSNELNENQSVETTLKSGNASNLNNVCPEHGFVDLLSSDVEDHQQHVSSGLSIPAKLTDLIGPEQDKYSNSTGFNHEAEASSLLSCVEEHEKSEFISGIERSENTSTKRGDEESVEELLKEVQNHRSHKRRGDLSDSARPNIKILRSGKKVYKSPCLRRSRRVLYQ